MALRRVGFQMLSAGSIGIAGDVLQQHFDGTADIQQLDCSRTLRLAVFRAGQAPFVDMAWCAFDRVFRSVTGAPGIALKVVADQCFLMPTSVVAFFVSQGCMEGLDSDAVLERVRRGFWPTVHVSTSFWPFVHCITFGVVPPVWRVTWVSCCAVFWTACLSSANQQAATTRAGVPVKHESAVGSMADPAAHRQLQ